MGGATLVDSVAGAEVWSYPNLHGDVLVSANSAGAKTSHPYRYGFYRAVHWSRKGNDRRALANLSVLPKSKEGAACSSEPLGVLVSSRSLER